MFSSDKDEDTTLRFQASRNEDTNLAPEIKADVTHEEFLKTLREIRSIWELEHDYASTFKEAFLSDDEEDEWELFSKCRKEDEEEESRGFDVNNSNIGTIKDDHLDKLDEPIYLRDKNLTSDRFTTDYRDRLFRLYDDELKTELKEKEECKITTHFFEGFDEDEIEENVVSQIPKFDLHKYLLKAKIPSVKSPTVQRKLLRIMPEEGIVLQGPFTEAFDFKLFLKNVSVYPVFYRIKVPPLPFKFIAKPQEGVLARDESVTVKVLVDPVYMYTTRDLYSGKNYILVQEDIALENYEQTGVTVVRIFVLLNAEKDFHDIFTELQTSRKKLDWLHSLSNYLKAGVSVMTILIFYEIMKAYGVI